MSREKAPVENPGAGEKCREHRHLKNQGEEDLEAKEKRDIGFLRPELDGEVRIASEKREQKGNREKVGESRSGKEQKNREKDKSRNGLAVDLRNGRCREGIDVVKKDGGGEECSDKAGEKQA